jgi:hypothetical protein
MIEIVHHSSWFKYDLDHVRSFSSVIVEVLLKSAAIQGVVLLLFLVAGGVLYAEGPAFHGSLSNRYKFRTTGALHDQDIETVVSLEIGDPRADRFSGAIQAGGIFDLDGSQGENFLSSVYDTFSSRAVGRLYYAYFDAKDLGPVKGLRAGRQHRYEFESLYFDGLTLESDPFHGFTLTAFGGVPVHLFENQLGIDRGDWLVGGALGWAPLSNLQFRFDYVHLKDKVTGFRASAGDHEDNLFGGSFFWDIDPRLGISARFTSFSDQVRDVAFSANFRLPDKDFSLRFDFFRLLQGYAVRVIEFDAFGIAGTFEPYTEFSLTATKGFGKHFAVDGGLSVRFLDDRQAASAFNHGFERVFLSLSLFEIPKGFSVTATGDYYRGEDNALRNDTFGGSLFLAQKLFKERLKISLGTAHYLYRFNLFSGNESTNVQTYFAGLDGKILSNLRAKVGYEFEDNDFNAFHSADVRLIWNF